jgi:hypothetical protein
MLRLGRMRLRRLEFARRTAVQENAVGVLITLLEPDHREDLREVVNTVLGNEGVSFRAVSRLFRDRFGLKLSDKTVADLWKRVLGQFSQSTAILAGSAGGTAEINAVALRPVEAAPLPMPSPASSSDSPAAQGPKETLAAWMAWLALLFEEVRAREPTTLPIRRYTHGQAAGRLVADLRRKA